MTPLEHMNRIDSLGKPLLKLASENILVRRVFEMYAIGQIETKEEALEKLIIVLAGSERDLRERLVRLHSLHSLTSLHPRGS